MKFKPTLSIKIRQTIRPIFIVSVVALLCSCSRPVQISEGDSGVSIQMGKLIDGVTGPATIQKPALGMVITFPRNKNIDIASVGNDPIGLYVSVVDPIKFYQLCMGNYDLISQYGEQKTKQLSKQQAITWLLTELNGPSTGIQVKIPED